MRVVIMRVPSCDRSDLVRAAAVRAAARATGSDGPECL